MRFYPQQHQYYCGIDLHARSMYLCILDRAGQVLVHRNIRVDLDSFLKAAALYREDEGTDEFLGRRERLVLPCTESLDRCLVQNICTDFETEDRTARC